MKNKAFFIIALLVICLGNAPHAVAVSAKTISFKAEIWADNWFALYINGKKVGEDSVSIKTERSFNSETISFKATYPLTVGVIAKDYVENSSGLEYIGKPNQQIGDAGIAIQITDLKSNQVVGYSNSTWKVLVIDRAPLNEECVTSSNPIVDCKSSNLALPKTWATSTYKDSTWQKASLFTKEEVGVKEGYFDITWSSKTKLIWSSDLRLDNTILLRKQISAPSTSNTKSGSVASAASSTSSMKNDESFTLTSSDFVDGGALPREFTCDGAGISPPLSWSSAPAQTKSFAIVMDSIPGPPRPGEVDSGKHFYFTLFNIPKDAKSIGKAVPGVGTFGQNFLGRSLGYTPPCSQGPGAKKYTITIYALSTLLDLNASEVTLQTLESAMANKILAQTGISVTYTR